MSYRIINGDSAKELKKFKDNSIDAVITDPPYGIEFLAKEWDQNTGAVEIWSECLRVLKPGGYLLAFSAARTYHILATNIQSVGFEIRDQIMWLYASGFPKAQDIGKAIDRRAGKKDKTVLVAPTYGTNGEKIVKNSADGQLRCPVCRKTSERRYHCDKGDDCGMVFKAQTPEALKWSGWKTALKPAHEPICMARKPMKGSTIDNVLEHGVGALNIDATRIPFENNKDEKFNADAKERYTGWGMEDNGAPRFQTDKPQANKKDQFANSKSKIVKKPIDMFDGKYRVGMPETHYIVNDKGRFPSNVIGEVEGYQKFFYCPKVSRKERHRGFENPGAMFPGSRFDIYMPSKQTNPETSMLAVEKRFNNKKDPLSHIPAPFGDVEGCYKDGERFAAVHQKLQLTKSVGNNHPTVKPVELMKYLIKLVAPKGSHIIDPFMGSGTTGMAAKELGITFTGIEMDKNYCEIAKRRIGASKADQFEKLFDDTIVNE